MSTQISEDTHNISEFFTFHNMITPAVIQVIFWIMLVVDVLVSIGLIVGNNALAGVVILVVGPLLARIYCELLIVVFRMHDALKTIAQNTTPAG